MQPSTQPLIVRSLPKNFALANGNHARSADGMCLMEAVAYIAGEPHSDHPACASPVLTRFGIRLNDRFTYEERQLLAPLIPKLVGTRATPEVDLRRAYCFADAAVRELVPLGLEAVKAQDLADRLRAIPPIVDRTSAKAAHAIVSEVRQAPRKVSSDAAVDAAASDARRLIVLASIATFEHAIAITEAS